MALLPNDESKEITKKYEELWSKIKDLIRSITYNSDDCDEQYLKIKFNLDDDLPLNKTLKLFNMIIVVRSVFHEGSKYYPVFLDESFYE